jgi:hypothetical protein
MVFAMDAANDQYLSAEAAPAAQYEQESAAYFRRWKLACAVTRGLSVAFAHAERPQFRPGRAEHEAHAQDVAEFAALARKATEANPAWQPTGLYLRWLSGRAVMWSEVEAQLAPARRAA